MVVGTQRVRPLTFVLQLDIQYIMGVAPNVEAWFYSNPSFDFWSDLTAWTAQLNNESNIPWVHSISYGDQGEFQPVRWSRSREHLLILTCSIIVVV